jgi:RimJ/RimL family protein N-acetyltransferase
MSDFLFRPILSTDHNLVLEKIIESWGSDIVISHETIHHPAELPGFGVFAGDDILGLLTYSIDSNSCEIVTWDSWREDQGIGTSLVHRAKQAACQVGCRRLWLVTTNDNTHALRFYQKRGFSISAIRINAVETARHLKPEIPETGADGIALRDEIELEIILQPCEWLVSSQGPLEGNNL